jgi:hypothetical protein
MAILSLLPLSPLIWVICVCILLIGARIIYSVYFGPLAKFPGPKLAAATLWYEYYYDVVLAGQYTFKIKELHQQYGMLETTPSFLPAKLMNGKLITSRPNYSD